MNTPQFTTPHAIPAGICGFPGISPYIYGVRDEGLDGLQI